MLRSNREKTFLKKENLPENTIKNKNTGKEIIYNDQSEALLQLRTILNNIPDAAWFKDSTGRYILVNKAFGDLCQANIGAILGKTDFEIWPKKLAEKYFSDDMKVQQLEERVVFEDLISKAGIDLWFETIKTPVKNSNGEITGTVGIARDITSRKKTEAKLMEFQKALRSLTLELTQTEEKERRRISIELHDHVCQDLAYCKMMLGELERNIHDSILSKSAGDIIGIIKETIQYTRSLTFELSPPVLYELGLEPAIEWLGEHIIKKRGIKFKLVHDDAAIEMSQELMILLFQTVREILTNTVKHSRAEYVEVSIRKTGQSIMISVIDNGVGFNVPELIKNRPNSYGFFSIRERLSHIGGYFNIKSSLGNGTRANIIVPLM